MHAETDRSLPRMNVAASPPSLVSPDDLTVFIQFKDDSKAKMVEGIGWQPYDPWQGRDGVIESLYDPRDYFNETMAAKWCASWKMMVPDAVSIGICTA